AGALRSENSEIERRRVRLRNRCTGGPTHCRRPAEEAGWRDLSRLTPRRPRPRLARSDPPRHLVRGGVWRGPLRTWGLRRPQNSVRAGSSHAGRVVPPTRVGGRRAMTIAQDGALPRTVDEQREY